MAQYQESNVQIIMDQNGRKCTLLNIRATSFDGMPYMVTVDLDDPIVKDAFSKAGLSIVTIAKGGE